MPPPHLNKAPPSFIWAGSAPRWSRYQSEAFDTSRTGRDVTAVVLERSIDLPFSLLKVPHIGGYGTSDAGGLPNTLLAMEQHQDVADLTRAVEARIPFNRLLGIELGDLGPARTTLSFEMRDDLVGNFTRGSLHGGVISATLDVAGGMSAITAAVGDDTSTMADRFARLGTIDLRVDYLRPGIGARFEAAAYTLRAGNKVAVTRMELRSDTGELVAVGTGTYIIG